MTRFSFELFLLEHDSARGIAADDFLEAVETPLFDAFSGDVTPALQDGVPVLYCSIEGSSFGDALGRVTDKILSLGIHPAQLLMTLES